MPTYEIEAKDLARRMREIEESRPAALVRGIVSAALLGAEVVAQVAPKDLGILRRSCRAELQPGGAQIVVDAPHAGIVEMGARPHWTPIMPLLEWARRHSSSEAEAQRLARGTQIKIASEGQRPTYFMRKSLPKLRKILKAEVEREFALEAERGNS